MSKTVYKYGTGHPVPEGAQYLSTQVEPTIEYSFNEKGILEDSRQRNELVWHYFLVQLPD